MAKLTVREFAKSVGLTTSGGDYIACTVMLKMLASKGVVKEVDRINTSSSGRGRKSVVYEIPEQVSFNLDLTAAVAPAPTPVVEETVVEETVVEETVEAVEPAVAVVEEETVAEPVAVEAEAEQKFYYDDDEDESMAA